jgi:high-affinity nickel permease
VICFLGIGASLFRQLFWQRTFSSTLLCSGIAMVLYEMIVFFVGFTMRLTLFNRIGIFAMTGLISWACMLPLYPLFYNIDKIGGNTWKE